MFEKFKKITIKGGCFEDETVLELFKGDSPLSIIYGRNGSGKSTIARCIKQLVSPEAEEILQGVSDEIGEETSHIVNSESPIDEEHKAGVFVFDEDFLRENVRVEKDGLNTIVMLGGQVELNQELNAAKESLQKKKEEVRKQEEVVKRYEDKKSPMSPLYYHSQIREKLRENGGWADIDRDLKGNIEKSRVTENFINSLIEQKEPEETYDQLRIQVEADKRLFMETESSQSIEWSVEEIILPENLNELVKLLERPLDSPQLSEREQRLMDLLTKINKDTHYYFDQHKTQYMLEEKWSFCPLCLREITNQDRTSIADVLTRLLNGEANEYNAKLNEAYEWFKPVEIEFPKFPGDLNTEELRNATNAKDDLNKILAIVRGKIEQRMRNIYEPLKDTITSDIVQKYISSLKAFCIAIGTMRKSVHAFNEAVNERNKLRAKVHRKNAMLARKYLANELASYKKALSNQETDERNLGLLKTQANEISTEISTLKAKLERIDIALDYINKELQYVFFSDRKLQLLYGDGCYKLKVNGKNVKPNKISVGERNVLGLCYFFAKMFSGKNEENKYSSEYLIVIDDPISSFDYGNRLGVMTLLRYQFGNIKKGNQNSRILVMTHDLQSVFDLIKVKKELSVGKSNKTFLELENMKITEQKEKNEYKKLLSHVYDYANCECPEKLDESCEISIGNIMRRLLEAFSSFCYNRSFEDMIQLDGLIDKIPVAEREYYKNFMYRLTLNGESHQEEQVYTFNIFESFSTSAEKRQTAKSVLLFLMYVNEPHLRAYLGASEVEKVKNWEREV